MDKRYDQSNSYIHMYMYVCAHTQPDRIPVAGSSEANCNGPT